jgi:hypothetical protein
MKTNFMSLFVFFIALGSFAQAQTSDPCGAKIDALTKEVRELRISLETLSVKSCADVKQASAVGTSCKTSQGFEFVRVEKGWKDKKSGKTWFDEMSKEINQYDSVTTCNDKGQSLPTGWPARLNGKNGFPNYDSDFVAAEKHGIREVFKDMKDRWFWSSSVRPNVTNRAYDFDGDSGFVDYGFRGYHISSDSARCVSR